MNLEHLYDNLVVRKKGRVQLVQGKGRILVVDDEHMICDVIHDGLSERGYLCDTVLNGNDALAKLAHQDFDVVLLDIRLPGMSGMEVLRETLLNHENTAAIMVTAVDDVVTAVEAMKLGASDYIIKPFDLDTLVRSIHVALEARRATDKPSSEMDAIASGVEVKLDPLSNYSKTVTRQTVEIAQQLGIDEKEIRRWFTKRSILDLQGTTGIESSLNKLERSPLAQVIMGMTEQYLCISNIIELQN